ncbi:MAG: glycosyltransferase [Clostridiales Family XIII bacterium]|jgi:glycosyltransferase involved in cell wall biosynthesis|nr:glycosyltransferase [Clostridiales Family XIII bacterium]
MSVKMSVIIPFFNSEEFLGECIESVVNQTLRDIEIICVNDGSTDGSRAIAEEYLANDERITLINKPNGGYGQTMNVGIAESTGEYIAIVESDDYVDNDMCESLYAKATAHDAQIVKADFYSTWVEYNNVHDEYYNLIPRGYADKLINPYEDYKIFQAQPAVWSAIYKRSLIFDFDIKFTEAPGAAFQDTGFFYKVLTAAEHVFCVKKAYLHHRQDNYNSSIKATGGVYEPVKELDDYFTWLRAEFPDKKKHLIEIMQDVVYKTFRWNIRRISDDLQPAFLDFMYDSMKNSQDKGYVKDEYFEPELKAFDVDLYGELQLLLSDKGGYLDFTREKRTLQGNQIVKKVKKSPVQMLKEVLNL